MSTRELRRRRILAGTRTVFGGFDHEAARRGSHATSPKVERAAQLRRASRRLRNRRLAVSGGFGRDAQIEALRRGWGS